MRRLVVASALFTAMLLAAPAAAETHLIDDDGGPGVAFTDLPPAIAAAAPGDLLLVRSGTYSGFVLSKGLAIVADSGALPTLEDGFAWIRDVPAGASVVFAGFTLGTLRIQNCAGAVHVDDCEIPDSRDWPALTVLGSPLVVVSRSLARGGGGTVDNPPFPGHDAQRGADLRHSTVLVSQCRFEGGAGGTTYKWNGKPGQAGLHAEFATVLLQSSTASGGPGGDGWKINGELWVADGGDGGAGVALLSSSLRLFGGADDVIAGAPGGEPNLGDFGAPGVALHAIDSVVSWSGVTFSTDPGGISVPAPLFGGAGSSIEELSPQLPVLRAGGSALLGDAVTLDLAGPAHAPFLLWVSPSADLLVIGTKPMPLLLDAGTLLSFWTGALDGSGLASLALAIPALPELAGLPVHVQPWIQPAAGPSGPGTAAAFVLR